MRLDTKTLSWAGLFAITGWLIQLWLASNFGPYAGALMLAGVIGTAGSGSLFVAPLGLLVGEFAAIFVLAPRYNALEIGVMVAGLSMTVLAGLVTRSLLGSRAQPKPE